MDLLVRLPSVYEYFVIRIATNIFRLQLNYGTFVATIQNLLTLPIRIGMANWGSNPLREQSSTCVNIVRLDHSATMARSIQEVKILILILLIGAFGQDTQL
jgi:hypothetical protein